MTKEEVIHIGTTMGLRFDKKTNFPDMLKKGTVVFDGINGQRFLIESTWENDRIYAVLGQSCIEFGKRFKAMQINNALSINSD